MKKPPLVSIIIVNFNGGGVFEDCLQSLSKVTYPKWELIIVDNGSRENIKNQKYREKIKNTEKKLKIIRNKDNLGFARANNQGVRIARGKYVLLLNNDTKVNPDFLSIMVSRMEKDPEIGVMQPKIFLMDSRRYLDNCGTFLTWTGFLTHWGFGEKDGPEFDKERFIFSAKGACLLTRKEIVAETGLFDEDFVSYFEESDFCWRVWLSGWRVLYFPKTAIFHKLGMTSKRLDPIEVNYHSIKNRIASIIKNASPANALKLLIPHVALTLALMTYYLLKFQLSKAKMIVDAVFWNITNFPRTLRKRIFVQRNRRVADGVYFKLIVTTFNFKKMFNHFKKVEANF